MVCSITLLVEPTRCKCKGCCEEPFSSNMQMTKILRKGQGSQ